MIIACDVDGVVADLHIEWLRRINTQEGLNLLTADITSWQTLEPWVSYLYDNDLYDQVPLVEQAAETIMLLREAGHRVFFATSCVRNMVEQKIDWLKRHRLISRSDKFNKEFVSVSDKSLIRADLLIDDALHNLEAFTGPWKIVFDQPWNRRGVQKDYYRAFGWDDVQLIIEQMHKVTASDYEQRTNRLVG